jgi:hypothetical protein
MPNKKRLVIVGATGMAGGYALRFALEDSAVISVMAMGRRPLGISHPKLNEVNTLRRHLSHTSEAIDSAQHFRVERTGEV